MSQWDDVLVCVCVLDINEWQAESEEWQADWEKVGWENNEIVPECQAPLMLLITMRPTTEFAHFTAQTCNINVVWR